jgi:hypothetical protein
MNEMNQTEHQKRMTAQSGCHENPPIDDEIRLPVAKRIEIKIADNGMVVVGSVFCTSAEQFHATLQRQMEHPFAELPKRRTRGPNKPKADADPRVTVPSAKKGGK